jgi:serine/threonine protein phosphatase PrpC
MVVSASRLRVSIGFASESGRRAANEDFALAREEIRGGGECLAIIADGMGGAAGGRLAAEIAVRGFVEAYEAMPRTLGIDRAAARALAAMNRWIHAVASRDPAHRGMATTLSALVLRGRRAHVVHVGDTRIYRLREGHLACLTHDHVHAHPDLRHVLVRAVGLEESVRADYAQHELRPHDRFLLCTDGVHGVLDEPRLARFLGQRGAPEEAARALVEAALRAGGRDNATALVLDVLALPAADWIDLESAAAGLPVLEAPRAGDVVDGFRLLEMIADGRYSRLFRAEDLLESRTVVLKFPKPRVDSDRQYRRAFVREHWIAAQVRSPYVMEVVELPPGRQTRLYTVMPCYAGESLEQRLRRAPPVTLEEGVAIGIKLAKAVYALNRARVIHRDIKPDNVLLERNGGLRLLDLGAARLPAMEHESGGEAAAGDIPGTPSYMAPELFDGARGDERAEVYALGVTLYRMWSTGRYPYGEIEPFSHPRFVRRTPLTRHRPDLPAWLDAVIARATAVDPAERHGDAMELALELERELAHGPPPQALSPSRCRPLYERDPLRFWQVVAVVLALALLLALILR